jgi:hypothetical protein
VIRYTIYSAVFELATDGRQQDLLLRLRLFDAEVFRMAAEDMKTSADKWEKTLSEPVLNKTSPVEKNQKQRCGGCQKSGIVF